MTFRIATFNCENLFSRSKVLNLENSRDTTTQLEHIARLEQLLTKDRYDQAAIWRVYQGLKDYVDINEEAGTFWKTRGYARCGVRATARSDWKGSIVFKRESLTGMARRGTGQVVRDTQAHVVCLVEVEGNNVLAQFNRELLNRRYKQHLLIDSPNDPRGIDVGLLVGNARFGAIHTHAFDLNERGRPIFSRDCLRVALELDGGGRLHVLCNHFKSKHGGDATSNERRRRQAERVAEILGGYDLQRDFVAVVGDFNDTPDSDAIAPLSRHPRMHDVLGLQKLASEQRWTYYYGAAKKADRKTQIDYILVSDALAERFREAEILRRGMTSVVTREVDEDIEPYEGMRKWTDAASDHAAVVATFDLAR